MLNVTAVNVIQTKYNVQVRNKCIFDPSIIIETIE